MSWKNLFLDTLPSYLRLELEHIQIIAMKNSKRTAIHGNFELIAGRDFLIGTSFTTDLQKSMENDMVDGLSQWAHGLTSTSKRG